ncbi:MAG: hypothetical protein WCU00_10440 [Candidatus Latescibacterota bacterium]
MKKKKEEHTDDMRPEYELDYSKAVRGKYSERLLKGGSNIVVLEPDVAKTFHDSATVNEALRKIIDLTQITRKTAAHKATGKLRHQRITE